MVGATNAETFTDSGSGDSEDFIAAIQVKDKEKLTDAIEREKPKELGEKDGAKLYQNDDSFAAVDDDVLVVANSRRELEAGLERRGSDDRFSEDDFDKGTEGLPENAVRAHVLRPPAADRRRPRHRGRPQGQVGERAAHLRAERGRGLGSRGLDFTMRTDSGDLTDADLPLAAGDQSPEVVDRPGQIGLGLRGLDQVVKFGESAAQAVDPAQFGSYETAKRTIERQLNLDLQKDVVDQLGGDISAGRLALGRLGGPGGRGQGPRRSSSARWPRSAGCCRGSPAARPSARAATSTASGLPNGNIAYGMVGDKFVLSDSVANARAAASAPTADVAGAVGAFAMKADAGQLLTGALSGLGGSGQLGGALGAQVFARPAGRPDRLGQVQHRRRSTARSR